MLRKHVPPASVSQIVLSYPEPHGRGALASSEAFFQSARQALSRGGTLTVVTDQESVYVSASLTLGLGFEGRHGFRVVESRSTTLDGERERLRDSKGPSVGDTEVERQRETAGERDEEEGGRAGAGGGGSRCNSGVSFFDALWTKRGFHKRWLLRCEAI